MSPLNDGSKKALQENPSYFIKNLNHTKLLSLDTQSLLLANASIQHFERGGTIWREGDACDFFVIILSGWIEITRFTCSDKEIVMGIFGPSDAVGISALLKKKSFPGTATVFTNNTTVMKLFVRPLLAFENGTTHEIQTWLRKMLLIHEQILLDKIDIMNAGCADNRLLALFRQLIARFGKPHNETQTYFIPIRLTRSQIAKLIDVRIETAIRMLSHWRKLNWIDFQKTGIILAEPKIIESLLPSKSLKN